MPKGFFPASVWQAQKQPLAILPECGRCKLDKTCLSPYMAVTGKGERKILIIGEAPGETEDERKIQFIGASGYELTRVLHRLGVNLRRDCWLFNALSCRPPRNRDPKKDEINFCRPNVTKVIQDLQPDVIIPLGKFAVQSIMPLAWKDGEVENIAAWAGWTIPCQKLNAWICPTYHPALMCYHKDQPVIEMTISKHLKKAIELKGKPWPDGIPDYKKQVSVIMDPEKAAHEIRMMAIFNQPMAIDIETTTLKPDGSHAEILCCSVSDGKKSIAFPWLGEAVEQIKRFLLCPVPKVVANLRFESRWFLKFLNVFPRNWQHDTLPGAHILNCTHGICSLKRQAFLLFGIPDYDSHIDPYKKSKGGSNTLNRMKELEPFVMMQYCGLDSLFEVMVANKQREQGAMR